MPKIGEGKIIVVIDDNETMLALFEKRLKLLGFTVSTALNGEEGLARIKDTKPNIVLTDHRMPKLSGDQVILEMRNCNDLRNIPVILMSGKSESFDFANSLGIVFLQKPFSTKILEEALSTALGNTP